MAKSWTLADIRALAKKTVDGKQMVLNARGEYLRALIGTAQEDIEKAGVKLDQLGQRRAVAAVHRRFYPVVKETVIGEDIKKLARRDLSVNGRWRTKERNRLTNFARSANGTIRRWLLAEGHDLMKLDVRTVTKSQLLEEAPPAKPHALTPQRIHARADRLIDQLVGFAKMIGKADPDQYTWVVEAALHKLAKLMPVGNPTTSPAVSSKERRPLLVGKKMFVPLDGAPRREPS